MFFTAWLRYWKKSLERRWALRRTLRNRINTNYLARRPALEALEERYLLSGMITVNSSSDGNFPNTLRYAINQVNLGTYNEIDFLINGGGAQTITLTSALPALTASNVIIKGYSQPVVNGSNTITINGSNAGSGITGLVIKGSGDTISGLVLTGFQTNTQGVGGNAIEVAGKNTLIGGTDTGAGNVISGNANDGILIDNGVTGTQVLGNYIGTDTSGKSKLGNNYGIVINGSNDTIGGTTSAARNLIDGSTNDGIFIANSVSVSGVQILGNYIGLNSVGTGAIANYNGIGATSANNTIGGTAAGAGNVISGNTSLGIFLTSSGVQILGNSIGTNAAGTGAVANKTAIGVYASGAVIGGTATGAGNVLSGNSYYGISVDSGDSGVQILGNSIGTNAGGTSAVANAYGVVFSGHNGTIGGTTSGAGNLISGNTNDGVYVGGTAVQVQGNYIGTNVSGNSTIGNSVGVEVAGIGDTIGGVEYQGYVNVISGNADGIVIDQNATGNAIQGNYIGTDHSAQSTTGLGNSDDGVKVLAASNTIGGAAAGLGNVIDGSTNDGIYIGASVSGVLIERNYLGVDNTTQSGVLSNGVGVEDAGTNNTIGASFGVSGNVIAGNKHDGILLDSNTAHDSIQGNLIGVGATLGGVANSGNGIEIKGTNNTVGGTTPATRNYIAANSGDGVLLSGSGNVLQGNYIGTTPHGQNNLGNGGNGVEVSSSGNVIGGSVSGATNVISGNKGDGVRFDSGGSGNTVQGNYLGCINYSSTSAIANSNGIEDAGGGHNLIGGTSSLAHNFISGNTHDGVLIGASVSGDVLEGNRIGTNAPGTSALSNSIGVMVQGSGNTIGGSVAGATNIISGNSSDGVLLAGSGNAVQGNFVGLKNDGQGALGNSGNGIEISQSSNTIGGTVSPAHNFIAGNSGDGVLIDNGGNSNQLLGNYIGLNVVRTAVANSNGVVVNGNNNLIGGSLAARNYISGNSKSGVMISSGSGNTISRDLIYANGPTKTGPGIVLSAGANNNILPPSISASYTAPTLTVMGSFTTTTLGTFALEFFANPSTDAEGEIYLGSMQVTVTTPGLQTFTFTTRTNVPSSDPMITATLTDPSGDTSAFSAGSLA